MNQSVQILLDPTSTMSHKKATTFAQAWLRDTAAYPIIAVIAGACSLTAFASVRYLTASPEVHWNKDNRKSPLVNEESVARNWNTHRNGFRNWSENAINKHQQEKNLKGF
ncbi:Aste57867_20603 [Aphanomyces stellatus]|uniref:Aste57867_20603 protein n=1 Tax=Aphanomyces stellatus TaxID=120398 RepID=A0A485LFF5_9STRA|nr:hypothetical protein As57867_020535 [Aphanomyces stellatus]VFT97283.1 Aste57867_20603 [Aphanomyces stellatus]